MSSWAERWTRFWFAPDDGARLGLLRILIGTMLVLRQTGLFGLQGWAGLHRQLRLHEFSAARYPYEGFRAPPLGLEWLPAPSFTQYQALELALLALAILFTLGLFTRATGGLAALGSTYTFLLSQFGYSHHRLLLLVALWILALSPSGGRYSLDRSWRHAPRPAMTVLPLRMFQVIVVTIYACATLFKLNAGWFSGQILEALVLDHRMRPIATRIFAVVPYRLASWATLLSEGFLAIGISVRRLRRLAVAVGIGLHLGIDLLMDVSTYSYTMIALYVAFGAPRPDGTETAPRSAT